MNVKHWVGLAILAAIASGCAKTEKQTAKVTGKVTYKGTPLTGGEVWFYPVASGDKNMEAGKVGAGPIDSTGNYEISTYGDKDGAVVGKNRIAVVPAGGLPKMGVKPAAGAVQFPAKYHLPKSSGLEREVKAGTKNVIDIDLVD